ncbi:MAG: TnpV protein [Planctomycetes bacterium]|nr:TnpV protein [Planctomycetota bacterium]
MMPLTRYGLMAEKHWREHRPKMIQELEAVGRLHELLLEAQVKTEDEMDTLRRQLMQQGLTAQQAHDQAWEMVREKYILLPAEND